MRCWTWRRSCGAIRWPGAACSKPAVWRACSSRVHPQPSVAGGIRTRRHRDLEEYAEHSSVPVVNAGTDLEHPCRALADCLTLRERFGESRGLPVAYLGDRKAVAHSL